LVDGARPDHLNKANPGGEPENKRKKEKTMRKKLSLLACAVLVSGGIASWAQASPYATEVVAYQGPFGSSPYNDSAAVLGKPSLQFKNSWGQVPTGRVKLVEPAYNVGLNDEKLITTLNSGSFITVKFDHKVMDDPHNPFGIDFLVFGNAMFPGSGWVDDSTNMNTYMLTGGIWAEDVTVSVSQDGINWYTYEDGPFGDNAFPTQAYQWDAVNAQWTDNEMDFTKPVDPALEGVLVAGGITAAEAIALYNGSGGGTGFDLAESGFEWIQYIKVEGYGGEIDAFADVAPVPVPGAIWLVGAGLLSLAGAGRRRSA
jgi:hypothetical protein